MFTYIKTFYERMDRILIAKGGGIALTLILISVFLTSLIDQTKLQQYIESIWIFGPILLILRKAASILFPPLSGSVSYIISGALYWRTTWVLLGAVGNVLWLTLAFYIGEHYGARGIKKVLGQKQLEKIEHIVHHFHNFKTFLAANILLFPLIDFFWFAAGMAKMKFTHFFFISLLLQVLYSFFPVYIGTQII